MHVELLLVAFMDTDSDSWLPLWDLPHSLHVQKICVKRDDGKASLEVYDELDTDCAAHWEVITLAVATDTDANRVLVPTAEIESSTLSRRLASLRAS